MRVVILAGGYGSRLSEYTDVIPKPMVTVGGRPILLHIMERFAKYGHTDFYIALGYKAEYIKQYFLGYQALSSCFTIDLSNGDIKIHQSNKLDWKVTLVDTGTETMTGGRVKRISKYLDGEPFLLTYGDGVADINIDELVNYHKVHKKMVTVTAVRPAARFGELDVSNGKVSNFKEKPRLHEGWINGGYFVVEPTFLNFIEGDSTLLEKEPLELASKQGELMAYTHDKFWQCMDTKRDRDYLEELWSEGKAPWAI